MQRTRRQAGECDPDTFHGVLRVSSACNPPATAAAKMAAWSGVPLTEILAEARRQSSATRVLVSGFDRYANPSVSSTPGASWVFTWQDMKSAKAFLATQMNGEPLTRDHGAPVRLVVPGWYGCTCIKWVDTITLVDDGAEATSQMQEYASRTAQKGTPRLAREYQPARIEQAAMPIRVEKWQVSDNIIYRVVGIAWGGSRPAPGLQIRFNPEEDFVPVEMAVAEGTTFDAIVAREAGEPAALKRMLEVEEVADPIVFLCSKLGSGISLNFYRSLTTGAKKSNSTATGDYRVLTL